MQTVEVPAVSAVAEPVAASEEARPARQRHKRRWTMQHPPDEINRVLRDYDAGMNADEIGRRHGISKATLYRWIAQFEDKRTVDDDPGSMRLRIATLEKVVLHLTCVNAELRAATEQAHAS